VTKRRKKEKPKGYYRDEEGRTRPITKKNVAAALSKGTTIRKVVGTKGETIISHTTMEEKWRKKYPPKITGATEATCTRFRQQFTLAGYAGNPVFATVSKSRTVMLFTEPSKAPGPLGDYIKNIPSKPDLYFYIIPDDIFSGRAAKHENPKKRNYIEVNERIYSKTDLFRALKVLGRINVSMYFPENLTIGNCLIVANEVGEAILITNVVFAIQPEGFTNLEEEAKRYRG